jgi:LysM repeat protein
MNTPNPLMPQGSLQQHQSRGKSSFRNVLFAIIAIHVVFFGGLLWQGCDKPAGTAKKADGKTGAASTNLADELPKLGDTNYYSNFKEFAPVTTNVLAPATNDVLPRTNQVISQSPPTQTPSTSKTVEAKEYIIVKGDTLAKVAAAHNVKLSELTKANPDVDSTKLKIGQKIQIPATVAPASVGAGLVEPSQPDSSQIHTVKAGETLTKIAQQHGTTVKALKAANNLTTDQLHVGKKLKLPAPQAKPAKGPAPTTSMSATKSEHNTPLLTGR